MTDYCDLCDREKRVKRDKNGDLKICMECELEFPLTKSAQGEGEIG